MATIDRLIGARMAYGRKLGGYSQTQIADKLQALGVDVTRDTIGSVESGRRGARTIEIVGYAKVLDRTPAWFYEDLPDDQLGLSAEGGYLTLAAAYAA